MHHSPLETWPQNKALSVVSTPKGPHKIKSLSRILKVTVAFKLGSGSGEDGPSIKTPPQQQDLQFSTITTALHTVEEEERPGTPDPDEVQPHLSNDVKFDNDIDDDDVIDTNLNFLGIDSNLMDS